MKINSTLSYLKNLSVFAGMALTWSPLQSCSVTESVTSPDVTKTKVSKKEREVKIYPDMLKKVMHVKNKEITDVDFFVFDDEGTILVHYKMNEKEHKRINNLEKGNYTYQVFINDEMSESAKITIR